MADERPDPPGSKSLIELPVEIWADILLRLPFKTILASAKVNRKLRDVIRDPTFVYNHLSQSLSKLAAINENDANDGPNRFILITPEAFSEKIEIYCDGSDITPCCMVDIPFESSRTINITGSCNGLLCLTPCGNRAFGRVVLLYNPLLHKCMKLKIEFSCLVDLIGNVETTYPVLGFGYHEVERDYRVVRLIYNILPPMRPRAEIYSVREKRWRSVRALVTATALRDGSTYVDGRIYWVGAENLGSPASRLIWFDLKDEVFGEMELPNLEEISVTSGVMRWNDKVTVYSIRPNVEGPVRCVFWVQQMSDIGKISWVEQLKFNLHDDQARWPVGFTWTGKLVFAAANKRDYFAYNFGDKNPKLLAFLGPYTVDTRFMESLALFLD